MISPISRLQAEHGAMLEATEAVIEALGTFDSRMLREEVDHDIHRQFGKRAFWLSTHLRGVLALVEADLYPSAFSVARTALEHQLMDELLMLADRYVQLFSDVDEDAFDALVARFDAGEEPTIVERPTRTRRDVRVVRRGLFDENDDPAVSDETISILFFVMDRYDPTWASPRNELEGLYVDGWLDEEIRRRSAAENRDLWRTFMTWSSVSDSLQTNGFMSERETRMLSVHYAFLSSFTHAMTWSYGIAWDDRGVMTPDPPTYDHYSSELALLYLLTIGARELSSLLAMVDRPPVIRLDGREAIQDLRDQATAIASHLWFPGGEPHLHDRVKEVNRRLLDARRAGTPMTVPPDPTSIPSGEVRYYRNPLTRLIDLHQSVGELAGLSYESPFHREDARLRKRG